MNPPGKHHLIKALLPVLRNITLVNYTAFLRGSLWIQTHKQQIITEQRFLSPWACANLLMHFGYRWSRNSSRGFVHRAGWSRVLLGVLNDTVILPKRRRGLPEQTEPGRGAPRGQSCMFSSLEDARSDSAELAHCQHFFKRMLRTWDNNQTLINWLCGDQNAVQPRRLARAGSARPSWMLFHPSWWLIQNQLSIRSSVKRGLGRGGQPSHHK